MRSFHLQSEFPHLNVKPYHINEVFLNSSRHIFNIMEKIKIQKEMLIGKAVSMLGILGVGLALIGVAFQHLFPWFTFKKAWLLSHQGTNSWKWAYYHISPFLIRYRLEDGIPQSLWFYRTDTTLIGVICLIGAMTGLLGVFARAQRINLVGGIIVMFSLPAFGICLPGLYPNIAWGFGAKLIFLGSIAILASTMTGYFKNNLQKN